MVGNCYVEKTEKYADKQFHCHAQELAPHDIVSQHMHDWVEILYCTKGEHKVYLGNSVLPFSAGSLVVIPINEGHRIQSVGEETGHYIVLKFSSELLLNIVDENEYDIIRPFMLMSCPEDYLFLPEALTGDNVQCIAEKMLEEYTGKEFGYLMELRALVYLMIAFIARVWHTRGNGIGDRSTSTSVHSKRIFECLQYIQKNYTQPITLEMLAKRCHVSYCYFSRQFSEVTGTSFAGYLSDVRVSAAEHLLITTDISITEIAFQVGFSDASYFTRRFSMKNGITPNVYRQHFSSLQPGKKLVDISEAEEE